MPELFVGIDVAKDTSSARWMSVTRIGLSSPGRTPTASISCSALLTSKIGRPASIVTVRLMSCPARMPGFTTCGVICDASGTWSVSGAQPVPFG